MQLHPRNRPGKSARSRVQFLDYLLKSNIEKNNSRLQQLLDSSLDISKMSKSAAICGVARLPMSLLDKMVQENYYQLSN
jgi:hypothetical protein